MSSLDMKLLDELMAGKVLNTTKAFNMGYGHYLPSRVYRLRKCGYNIKSWPGDDGYHNYFLDLSQIYSEDFFVSRQLSFNLDENINESYNTT